MFKDLGSFIKMMRTWNHIGLNELARRLHISPAYLSNLENGKTESVHLSFLDALPQELSYTWTDVFRKASVESESGEVPYSLRIQVAINKLEQLSNEQPKAAEFLIGNLESGLAFFSSNEETVEQVSFIQNFADIH